jgi:cytoskeletal protein CcmA (bactofilin family)
VAVDEVNVPAGATCTLEGTTVDGNVSVGVSATLIARGVSVDGDVEAEGARDVKVTGTATIGGNLQADANNGGRSVSGNRIEGDLQCEQKKPATNQRTQRRLGEQRRPVRQPLQSVLLAQAGFRR